MTHKIVMSVCVFAVLTLSVVGVADNSVHHKDCLDGKCNFQTGSLLQHSGRVAASFKTVSTEDDTGTGNVMPKNIEKKTIAQMRRDAMPAFRALQRGGPWETSAEFDARGIDLNIESVGTSPFRHGEPFSISVTVQNTGTQSYVMVIWESPFEKEEIFANLFKTEPPSTFMGRIPERWLASINENNSVLLRPGASHHNNIDLNRYLTFPEAGNYTLELDYDFMFFEVDVTGESDLSDALAQLGQVNEESATQADIVSNKIHFIVEDASPVLTAHDASRQTLGDKSIGFNGCTSSQRGIISAAAEIAKDMIAAATVYLQTQQEQDDWKEWFGTASPIFEGSVTDGVVALGDYFQGSWTADCSCNMANVYAYVYPSQPQTIYLCPVFWNSPSNKARDSQPGTLIHEASHFTTVMGTTDHAYGTTALRSLAANNPAHARENADSLEGYTEDPDLSLSPPGGGSSGPPSPTPPPPQAERINCGTTSFSIQSGEEWRPILQIPAGTTAVTISTCGSATFDTVIKAPCQNDDASGCSGHTSRCTYDLATAQTEVEVNIHGYSSSGGSGSVEISCAGAAPATSAPSTRRRTAGAECACLEYWSMSNNAACRNQRGCPSTACDGDSGGAWCFKDDASSGSGCKDRNGDPVSDNWFYCSAGASASAPTTPSPTVPQCVVSVVEVKTRSFGNENSISIGGCTGDGYRSKRTTETSCCLSQGVYTLTCTDSYGDGWHGGYVTIQGTDYCKSQFDSSMTETVVVR